MMRRKLGFHFGPNWTTTRLNRPRMIQSFNLRVAKKHREEGRRGFSKQLQGELARHVAKAHPRHAPSCIKPQAFFGPTELQSTAHLSVVW